jgi:hypothetical protein
VGGLPHQTAYPSYKDFGWMVFLGIESRSVGVVLAEGLWDFRGGGGGGITSAEGLRDGEAGRAPFLIMPWHSPYNWGKARKTSVRMRNCILRGHEYISPPPLPHSYRVTLCQQYRFAGFVWAIFICLRFDVRVARLYDFAVTLKHAVGFGCCNYLHLHIVSLFINSCQFCQ